MLRRKNCLMRAGSIDEADTLAVRVRKAITNHSSKWLRNIDTKMPGPKSSRSLEAHVEIVVS